MKPTRFSTPRGLNRPIPTKAPEVVLTFDAGETIFSKGDPGGDLFFIESGRVEIFIEREKSSIVLADMGPGEIIGVMTFLTKDARLASARATEPTSIKKIPSMHIQKHIAGFPKWLKIVLKEFVGRINEMNRMYSESTLALKKAKDLQITPLFLATQMAQALGIVGKGIGKDVGKGEGNYFVPADELSSKMQLVLNQPKDMIDGLCRVFADSGLMTLEASPDKKQKGHYLANLEAASIFTQFVRESVQGTTRKLLKAKLTSSEIKATKAVCSYALSKGFPPESRGAIKVADLMSELQLKTGLNLDLAGLTKPAKIGMLDISGEGQDATITMAPLTVHLQLSCIEAIRRLTNEIDGIESSNQDESSVAEKPAA